VAFFISSHIAKKAASIESGTIANELLLFLCVLLSSRIDPKTLWSLLEFSPLRLDESLHPPNIEAAETTRCTQMVLERLLLLQLSYFR